MAENENMHFTRLYLHGSGNFSWGIDVHLVEQWLQEVFVLERADGKFNNSLNEAASTHCKRLTGGHKTHGQLLDLSSEGRMKSHMLKQGRPESYAEAGLLALAVFLQKESERMLRKCYGEVKHCGDQGAYRIFFRIADFDPENVVQQPVNGLFFVEHEYELHN